MKGFLDYSPGNSILHKMNPLTKLLLAFFLCLAGFLTQSHLFLLAMIGLNLIFARIGGISGRAFRMLKSLVKLGLFLFLFQLLFIRGGTVLLPLPFGLAVTDRGLSFSSLLALRLIAATMPLALMLSLTKMGDLTNVLVGKLCVPYRYAFALTTALRFIPVFSNEMEGIMEAQTARGVAFDTKNVFKKIRLILPLCVPLLIASVRKIESAAISAELRGISLRTRESSSKAFPFRVADYGTMLFSLVILSSSLIF